MLTMFKYKGIKYVLLLFAIGIASCSKQLDSPSREVAAEELHWRSISETKAGLLGIYGLMRSAMITNNGHWVYGEIRGGDFSIYNRADLKAIKEGKLNAAFNITKSLSNWQRFYAVVNAASVFIEKAPQVLEHDNRYTDVNLKMDIVQARALRAFAYYYMARTWGDVPLITKSYDNGSFPEVGVASQQDVLNYAEKELLESVETLPYQYGTDNSLYYNESRWLWQNILITKIGAYSILAHIAALQGRYDKVEAYTRFFMDNYSKSNVKKLTQIHGTGGGSEALTGFYGVFSYNYGHGQLLNFATPYLLGEATNSGHIEQLTLAQPLVNKEFPDIYVEKDSISVIFDDLNDRRFGLDTVNGLYRENYFINFQNDIPIFKKINIIRDGSTNGNLALFGSNLVFSRYEEMVLLRAEALEVLNDRNGARSLLNEIRSMRGLRTFTVLSPEPILEEIFKERRRELMGEGWLFFDLVRYHKIKQNNPKFMDLINRGGIYWPIASEILSRNSMLKQNSYWN